MRWMFRAANGALKSSPEPLDDDDDDDGVVVVVVVAAALKLRRMDPPQVYKPDEAAG